MPKKLVVMIIHPPYGHENAFAGFFVALASLSKGLDVTVALNCDGVFTAVKGQKDPEALLHLPSIEKQLKDILDLGGRIVADTDSAATRGVNPEDCVEGIEFVSPEEMTKVIKENGELMVTL
ncbi:MAG TPA: hypothetical protein ENN25_05325 [Euryarchaeota archaeon]|nr:hypothetical protein [Euryarchaeota archaeon]